MSSRQIFLVIAVALAFFVFVLSGASNANSSVADIIAVSAFGLFFTGLVFVMLAARGNKPVEGHRGLPRLYWVVFASFATAFAVAMLLSIAALPWFGYGGFDFFFGSDAWWVLLALAAVAFPFIRRHLL
jgi:hypothetical protein